MPDVALSLIDPNPFRDFDLHPINQAQVERLKASIAAEGFWTSVVARRVGDRHQLAFGHHRIEAARGLGWDAVPIDVHELTDWHMVQLLAAENALQRGTTAAASLDAIAALSQVVISEATSPPVENFYGGRKLTDEQTEAVRYHLSRGEGPGWRIIQAIMPKNAFTQPQVVNAIGVLKDSGRMATIIANARGDNQPVETECIFDANCARLFKLDSHLAEFRRIVTGDVVRSYLPVERQFDFARQIIAALGTSELTAIKLRERANVIFYEELGMPRHAMRNSSLRISDDRVRDALNLMRRGTYDVTKCCDMLGKLIAEGVEVDAEVIDRFKRYISDIDAALKSLTPERSGKRGSNLRLIVNNREDVA